MKTFYFNPENYGTTWVVMAKTYEEAVEYIRAFYKKLGNDEMLELFENKISNNISFIELKEGEVFQGCNC